MKIAAVSTDHVNLNDGGYRRRSRIMVGSLLVVVLLVGLTTLCFFLVPNQAAREARLRQDLANYFSASNFDAAMISLQALRQLSPESQQLDFQQAVLEHARGNVDTAKLLIDRLVDNRYPEAACWALEKNVDQRDSQWSEQEQLRFEDLISIALHVKDPLANLRVKQRWAANRIQLGLADEALTILEQLSQHDRASSLHAASIAKRLGLNERARSLAFSAQRYFAAKLAELPHDDQCRLNLARAYLLLDQESDSLRLLSDGYQLTRQPKFQQAAGETMICWANRLKMADENSTVFARVRLVHRATQCAPNDQAVLSAVVDLMGELAKRSESFTPQLREAIAQGHDPESGHFILGLLTLAADDTARARLHLDLAEKAGSHVAIVLNNLALIALEDSRLTIEQGLVLADEAIRRLPDEPRFRETRSRFLLRQERYEAAIVDLLAAAEVDELKPWVEKNLKLAYAALDAAASHGD